jgi:multiple sugar transport system substrate-binding protein
MNTGKRPTADFETELLQGRLSRRQLLGRGAALGVGAPLLGAGIAMRTRSASAQEKVKIRLATWVGAEEGAELQTVIDKVNGSATAFEIVSEPSPADYYTKLQTTLAGSSAADLFWLSQEYVAGYADRGALLDLTDRLAADDSPAADLNDYVPAMLQTAQYDSKTFGLPWISQPVVLYYNPELFATAGIAEPDETWTWDTFKQNAAALTDKTKGVYGTSFNGWPPIQMFIWQAGGEVIAEDLKSCPIDSPEAEQAADFYASFVYNEEYAPSEATITEQGFGEMAKAGKIAMFYGGAADDLDYAHKKDPKNALLKVALVPQGPKSRTTFAWTAATVVNSKAKNPDVAYQALVALTEGIHHWKIVAPRTSLETTDVIAASVPDKAESAATILKAVPDMRSFHVIPDHQEWDTMFADEFLDPLFHHEGSAADLAANTRADLESLLP